MAELQPLLQTLADHCRHGSPSPPDLSNPSLRPALSCLSSLLASLPWELSYRHQLQHGSRKEEEEEKGSEGRGSQGGNEVAQTASSSGRSSGHQEQEHHWSPAQLDFVLSIAEAVIVQSSSLPLEQGVTETLESVVRSAMLSSIKSLKCLAAIVNSKGCFTLLDEQVCNKLVLLLELAVMDGKAKEPGPVDLSHSELLAGLVLANTVDNFVHDLSQSYRDDQCTPGSQELVEMSDDIIQLLTNDMLLEVRSTKPKNTEMKHMNIQTAMRQFMGSHMNVCNDLLETCRSLLVTCNMDCEIQVRKRVALVSRMLKLLNFLTKFSHRHPMSVDSLKHLAALAAWIPQMLFLDHSLNLVEVACQNCCYATFLSSMIELAEEACVDQALAQNFRIYIASSALDLLVTAKLHRSDGLAQEKVPVVCEPQVVSYICGLIKAMHAPDWHRKDGNPLSHNYHDNSMASLVLQLRAQDFLLYKARNREESIELVFPSDGKWLNGLMDLVALLYRKGMEARPVNEKPLTHKKEDHSGGTLDSPIVSCEDEALFGDLFSESSRQPAPNESCEPSTIINKRSCGPINTALQAVIDVLRFLKDCIFCSNVDACQHQSALKHLSTECLDLLLDIFFHSVIEVVDQGELQTTREVMDQLGDVNFDLLHSICGRGVLPPVLHEHVVQAILEKGYTGCTMLNKTLILLATLLISQPSSHIKDDVLNVALWNSFKERVISSVQVGGWIDLPLKKAATSLPSIFYLEVLLMAFHSSQPSTRSCMLKILNSLVQYFCHKSQHIDFPRFSPWSILFSRVVMILRYTALHFGSFPGWLLGDLKAHLGHKALDSAVRMVSDQISLASLTATIGQSCLHANTDGDNTALSNFLRVHLYDINLYSSSISVLKEAKTEFSDLCGNLSSFLEQWRGKTVKQVEELLVERYSFHTGWTTVRDFSKETILQFMPPDCKLTDGSSFGADCFLRLTQSLYGCFCQEQDSEIDGAVWWKFLMDTLCNIETAVLGSCASNMTLIDIVRQAEVSSVLLLLLQRGLESSLVDQGTSGQLDSQEKKVLSFCEQMVYFCVKDGSIHRLFKVLSSLLTWHVESLHRAMHIILTGKPSSKHAASSIYLVLVAGVGRNKQEELLSRMGVASSLANSILRQGMINSWHAETVAKFIGSEKMCTLDKIFLSSFLHGFPCSSCPESAIVTTSMFSIECLLDTVRLLLRVDHLTGGVERSLAENGTFSGLLDALFSIQLMDVFEGFHHKCAEILRVLLLTKDEQTRHRDLRLLKQQEYLLRALSHTENISAVVREELIVHIIEVFNNFQLKSVTMVSDGRHLVHLVDVLDGCYQENINVKVLHLLMTALGCETSNDGLRSELQKKFLTMDNQRLCSWLEQRLLGYKEHADRSEISTTSSSVRDLTVSFLCGLVSSASSVDREDLCTHFLHALLSSLERALKVLENGAFRSYFTLLVQLMNGESLLRQALLSITDLLSKFPDQAGHMEGLKALLAFLSSILSASCGQRTQAFKLMEGKQWGHSTAHSVNTSTKAKHTVLKKASESSQSTMELSGQSVSAECDAISVDEDDDDGTSDGEIASLDKDDDDDGSNSERALASRICTFTSSGNNFMEQHWYFCYTCDLTISKGCCSICARVCHRGHKVVYSRFSRFFCDCGAGGERGQNCQCLKPRKYVPPSSTVSSAGQEPPSDSESDLEEDTWDENDRHYKVSLGDSEQKQLLAVFSDFDVEGQVLSLCERLISRLSKSKSAMPNVQDDISLGEDKQLIAKTDFLHLKRAYKSGSFDMKIKADYVNAKDLKSHLVNGSLLKSLLTINSRGKLAVGEGDKVTIFDIEQVIGSSSSGPVIVDKTTVKPLFKNPVRFELVHLVFNSANESYLAVAGYEDCQIFSVSPRGEVTDRLPVELALQDAYIRRIIWVPGSQVQLMVVTNKFVKIYDLSQDNISPVSYFTVPEDFIADASLLPTGQGQLMLLVLSSLGVLYRHHITTGADPGARILTDTVLIPERFQLSRGVSVHFSPSFRLLFLSYSDGLSLVGRLNADGTFISDVSALLEVDQDGKLSAASLHHWQELLESHGLYISLTNKRSNSAVAVGFGPSEVQVQYLRSTGSLGPPRIDGIVAYKAPIKDKADLLILHDDGSLQVFSLGPGDFTSGNECLKSSSLEAEQVKKLSDALLVSKANNSPTLVFPLDFFEKTICITDKIRLGGDVLRNNDSEGAKLSLTLEDGFIEGPSPSGFQITVHNSNADIVMVGCRLHVGNSSTSHIPSEIRLFQRVIKLEEGVCRWYDFPFTNPEALLADEEFTLTIGPTFSGFALPRIDSLEVYGRPKDEFGWKEKIDAVLDMETHISTVVPTGSGTKYKLMKNAPIEEQIMADCFMFLCCYYLASRMNVGEVEGRIIEASRKRCQPLLELVFETDRQPLLQAAARRILRALYPGKDAFYQAKDMLRLTGVSRMCPLLVSKLGTGGSLVPWAIQEFTAQMKAVCKIALHRRSNLASYLDTYGSSLVDGLMQVLWELLSMEQPDAEVVNSLVIPSVDLIYGYAECLAGHANSGAGAAASVAPAVALLRKLIFAPYEVVRSSCSLAMSSRLLQVPFPKQTLLANDDGVDGSRSMQLTSESGPMPGVADGQNIVEEDGGNASVQYCCDGCSTVPIVGRRWHCNVCPDFDLCEACYEAMDGDRLPPPHTRDHRMSALPIEVENTMSGEGGDIQFASIDELSDENLLQVATELSRQSAYGSFSSSVDASNSKETIHNSVAESKVVKISASKRALNSMLLKSLLDDIKGWMHFTSGIEAVPLMQFFYRLASAPASPFIESSGSESIDLERFVLLLLEELDLGVPLAVKSRSGFGEVVILVFTFFNLMLRNWHQPGSEQTQSKGGTGSGEVSQALQLSSGNGSPASEDGLEKERARSQLDRGSAALRQQVLLNYLLSIVQQLGQIFKRSRSQDSSTVASLNGPSCGALLVIKKEFTAGNFAPFFTDSYAKAHRSDLFGDFHRLMLESAFRLAYNLVRPEKSEKSVEKDPVSSKLWMAAQDLKLDGWQDILCSYINNPHTTSIKRFARRLLLHLCGSKGHYYNVRDAWQLSREVKKLYKLVQKAGGFQGLLVYERSVKLVKCLSAIVEVAVARPRNWQKYCSRHPDILQFLLNGIFLFGEESVVQTLKLLTLAFYAGKELGGSTATKESSAEATITGGTTVTRQSSQVSDSRKKKKGSIDETADGLAEKSFLDMELAVEQLAAEEGKVLMQFIDVFLLEWNAASVRTEAKSVIYGAWHHGRQSVREMMLKVLLQKVPVLPSYGQNIVEYTDLLTWILSKGTPGAGSSSQETSVVQACLTADVVKVIFDTLRSQNELLANHPNSRIYNTLSSLVEFDGYYLESEPCLACSCPEVPFSRMKLDNLKSETKFTDNRILVKCVGSHTIQSVTMNVHDARRSKSVKVLNLYYNNRPVTDLSELKNNWSLWKRAKSCYLAFNQTELKVEFPIPITACNFMIELDSFYENLQASSLESLQCPRCSRYVTDKHGICGNCRENAYQCRQCRNINYENLDSFLCNECGYSKYGRFEFNFMAKPSFHFESMENDDDMKKGLAAIEIESENAHKRYQQLLGFKKPLLKLVSSIGETEMDSQQINSVQQMIVSLPGSSSFKINRKIVILGVLYGEKCKMAFDSVSRSVQTLQGLMRVLTSYLEQKRSPGTGVPILKLLPSRPSNRCYGCANTFVGQCLEWLHVLAKMPQCRQQLVSAGILSELFENNIHQGSKTARIQARAVLCAFTEGDAAAVKELNDLIKQKAMYCLDHHRSIDISTCVREDLQLLSETCVLVDEFWESRLRIVFQLLFSSIQVGARHPAIAEHIILPCLRIISQACTPPKPEASSLESDNASGPKSESRIDEVEKTMTAAKRANPNQASKSQAVPSDKDVDNEIKGQDMPLVNYTEWKNGATYLDFVRRQYTASYSGKPNVQKLRRDPKRADFLALKYILKWKRRACKVSVANELSVFENSSWVCELVLSACSQAIRVEMCGLIEVLCSQSPARRTRFLNLLMNLLPSTRTAGESACDYFELLYKMIEPEDARLFLTVRGFLQTLCRLITEEVSRIEAQEHSFHTDISQGYILHKFIELLGKFLQVPNIRVQFMKDELLSQVLEALLVVRGLVVQKTKLIGDCGLLLRELLDGLLQESFENKRHFIRACIAGLQTHARDKKDRTAVFILELLCNIICPTKPEPAYMMVLNKAHTQEEFIRGSMTKNPYSSLEVGPLMRDVKNKICHQLDLLALIEDDYGMELLVAGNIISLDLSVAQVYEQVWRKAQSQASSSVVPAAASSGGASGRECPPMNITYRLQGLDGEATEPMIKELDDDKEESQDPEVEFAIAGVMRDCNGLQIVLRMVQALSDDDMKSSQEELALLLKLIMYCCKVRDNRLALLHLGALGVLLETARRAFAVEATETAEGLLLIVECLVTEANESDIGMTESSLSVSKMSEAGGQAAHVVHMFLERLSHSSGGKKSTKQQRNNDMVARILPYLTYGEQAAMEVLVKHFEPYLQDWKDFDLLQRKQVDCPGDESLALTAAEHRLALENFCKVTESIKHDAQGERLKGLIMQKGITLGCIQHIKETFSVFENGGDYKATAEWSCGLELPSIPLILLILRGLSRGYLPTQRCLDEEGVLPLLHALEGVPGESEIGARAENLLDTLADKDGKGEGYFEEKVMKLRHATRDEMRRRALQKREELLQGLGMRQEHTSGGKRIVISVPSIEGLEDLEEEEAGLACMVCREGYSLCPTDMLGTYCYSKRVNLGLGTSSSTRAEWVYTTVSHFNVIHFHCHLEAKRADASLKNPKKEWEGATLRNNETLCNNLFPLRGPSVPLAQYARCVDQYWDNLNALGRADGSRLRLLTYDIVLMLARFATGASFSTDSKGGGKESNSRLLPFMLQMACHLLDQGGPSQRRAQCKALATYLSTPFLEVPTSGSRSSSPGTPQKIGAVDETVQFMMVQSLLLESLDEWQLHRRTFLQGGIYHAYMQFKHGRMTLAAPTTPVSHSGTSTDLSNVLSAVECAKDESPVGEIKREQLFAVVQPMLIYTGLIDQLQRYLKQGGLKSRVAEPVQAQQQLESSKGESSSGVGALEVWEMVMKDRLRDTKAMLGLSKDLLEWLDDMLGAEDLQEAFDVMGALGDALSGGFPSCEDFVLDIIRSAGGR